MSELKKCPCGKIPEKLMICANENKKIGEAYCPHCQTWGVEFRSNNLKFNHPEVVRVARETWNLAPRGGVGNKSDWISVNDRLPEDKESILYYIPLIDKIISGYKKGLFWHESKTSCSVNTVTHWMPLPEKPK